MTPSLIALCGFAAWTVLLVFALANVRVLTSQRTGKAVNTFNADGSDIEGFGQRLTRAHLNCVELLPVFAAVILAAAVAGKGAVTDGLAMTALYARFGQSIVHMASTAVPAVLVRATLFVVQLAIIAWWIFQLLTG
jgi:uncharacterized MAPEG superfamily protein